MCKEKYIKKKLLFKEYSTFIQIVYGNLGKVVIIPLASCVEFMIRRTFPEVNGEYFGFQEVEKYDEEEV